MNLGLEYLIRSGLIKSWLSVPCSLFLTEYDTDNRLVVTIGEEFKPSEFFSVKHWHISNCQPEQALPSITEGRVPKADIFSHPMVIVPGHRLFRYHLESIPVGYNHYSHPMSNEVYDFFFDASVNSLAHRRKKHDWLWERFLHIYVPNLLSLTRYINSAYRSDAEIAEDQRQLVQEYYPAVWAYWEKWTKYMLHLDSTPGELIFSKEYRTHS